MPITQIDFWTVARCCSETNLDAKQPLIDLSDVTFFTPFGLLYLGMFLRYFANRGKGFVVNLPTDSKARSYLARQNFWERFNFDPDTISRESLRRLTTSTSLNDIVDIESNDYIGDEIGERLRDILITCDCPLSPSKVALIVAELVDNFAQHSEKTLAALALQYYPNVRNLRVAIADCGIGIRESLASNPKHKWVANEPHHVAVLEAFKPGISRKREGGVGFTDILDGVNELGGRLSLATGDQYVVVRKGNAKVGDMTFNLPGVQVELFLPGRSKHEN